MQATGAQSDPGAAVPSGKGHNGTDDSSMDGDGMRNSFPHRVGRDRKMAAEPPSST